MRKTDMTLFERIDDWTPDALLKRLNATDGMVVNKARVQCGGEHGSVAVFITSNNDRFTYTMPSKSLAVRAIMRQIAANPLRFPLKLTSDSKDRAVFKARAA